MKDFFKRVKFWLEWSSWLRCKHMCMFCKYFDECVQEVNDIEARICMKDFFE